MASVDELRQFAPDCVLIAQQIAPKDTGNLAFNSIRLEYTPTGFKIIYDLNIAFYTEFQQEGTRFFSGNAGFIDRTHESISSFLTYQLSGNGNNVNINRELLAKQAVDNPARQDALLKSTQYSLRGV